MIGSGWPMHGIFQTFVDRLNDARDPEDLRNAMADAAAAFELQCFAYLSMPRDGRAAAALISTYPALWTERYLNEHYERLDPVIVRAHDRTEPFVWGLEADGPVMTQAQVQLFDEAAMFGIRCGFTIPIRDGRGPIAAVTFASDQRHKDFQKTIRANQRVLQLMSICLHSHARRKFYCEPHVNGTRLSPRELECLHWAAAGKSAWAIGQILRISRRTVAYHLDNARSKLGVQSLRQAIAILATYRKSI
ncbi:MAG: autoinducer binding domain-containing protein [Pseudomonadota bacterium]